MGGAGLAWIAGLAVNGNKVVKQHGCDQKGVVLPGFEALSGCLRDPFKRKSCLVRKSIGAYRCLVVAAEATKKRGEHRREQRRGAL